MRQIYHGRADCAIDLAYLARCVEHFSLPYAASWLALQMCPFLPFLLVQDIPRQVVPNFAKTTDFKN